MLLFSRGVNFQYVWREFWECDGCASSQLVRSNILQALFATPLDSSNHCYWQNPYMMDVGSLETDVKSVLLDCAAEESCDFLGVGGLAELHLVAQCSNFEE